MLFVPPHPELSRGASKRLGLRDANDVGHLLRDLKEQELGLRFDPDICNWVLLGSAERTVMLTTDRQTLLTAMSGMSCLVNARELAAHMGKSYPATVKLLQRMQAEGLDTGSRGKDAGWSLVHEVSGMSSIANQDIPDS